MLLRQRTPYCRAGRADWLRTCKKVGEILKKNGFPKNILLVADKETIKAKKENTDWADVYSFYGEMADDVRKLNEPKTATDEVNPKDLQDKWQKIREIIHNIPSYDEVYSAMKKAGCKLTVEDIGKSQELVDSCIKYSPYMRYRLTLLRLRDMIV